MDIYFGERACLFTKQSKIEDKQKGDSNYEIVALF